MSRSRSLIFVFSIAMLFCFSCQTIDLYEKIEVIPKHKWEANFKPTFQFEIKDTTVPYQLYAIFRHNEMYRFNNVWINLHTIGPDSSKAKAQYELPLATNEKGWLASAMDDIYEHRIALTPLNRDFYFKKAGVYTFTIEHVMREDPLEHVMNVGLRVEKRKP
ncbi:MAG TPA: gliding motility lipoprotein GldH [Chitinophagaceae bacterium]